MKAIVYDRHSSDGGCDVVWNDTYEPYLSLYEEALMTTDHPKIPNWPPPNWSPGTRQFRHH